MEPGQVRLPDVCFFAWEKFPNRLLPRGAILDRRPDLAVEILSPSNTRAEMARKRREYFAGGARLIWEVNPETRRVRVYTDADTFTELGEEETLDGGPVLPGFSLPIRRWFERAGERAGP
jgi:Uma2 family endonuclease